MLKVCTSVEDQSDFYSRLDVANPENYRSTFGDRKDCQYERPVKLHALGTQSTVRNELIRQRLFPYVRYHHIVKDRISAWTIDESTIINLDVIALA
jgi:hypothetical protein